MMVVECPDRGRLLLGEESLQIVANVAPGTIVCRWECPCGADHVALTGRHAPRDRCQNEAMLNRVLERLTTSVYDTATSQPSNAISVGLIL